MSNKDIYKNEYEKITEKEVIDIFYNKYSIPLTDFLSNLKEKMYKNGNPILNNCKSKTNSDFLEFILYNIKLEKMYKKNVSL
tara:strand:- start:828 stop:1073 length:246 start_codon:yes stop_codon:yes gene_type:complete